MCSLRRTVLGAFVLLSVQTIGWAAGPADFLVDQLKIENFKQHIADFSAFSSRYVTEPGNAQAIDLIKQRLESYGYTNVVVDPYTTFGGGMQNNNIYATKIGSVTPLEMYIVSAHLDSFSTVDVTVSGGADDDASGIAFVLELARVFATVDTDRSIRFAFFNDGENGLDGSVGYAAAHIGMQGTPSEPTWIANIHADMILYDRSAVPDADVAYNASHDPTGDAAILASFVSDAMVRYGTLPTEVSSDMCCTDSDLFADSIPAIVVRENRYQVEILNNSNPNYHQPTDVYSSYTDTDFEFGFNIVKMSGGALAELVSAAPVDVKLPTSAEDLFTKDRYITIDTSGQGSFEVAYRVNRIGGGGAWYADCGSIVDGGSEGLFAGLTQTMVFCDWSASPILNIHGCEIVPGNAYTVEAMYNAVTVTAAINLNTTAPVIATARQFGDSVGAFAVDMWSAPDGVVNSNDIVASVQKFSNAGGPPHRARVDTDGKDVNAIVSGSDILRAVRGFSSEAFDFGVTNCLTGVCLPSCP